MKKLLSILLIVAFQLSVFGQQDTMVHDPAAKTILDQVSTKIKSYQTFRVKFGYTLENTAQKSKEYYQGYLFVKGGKFKLILPIVEIISDGKTQWTYMKESNEVNITEPDPNEESALNPVKMFTIYEKGFKYRVKDEYTDKNRKVAEIDLYPEKPSEKKYSLIKLKINKNISQLISMKYQGKEGTNYTIEILDLKPNVKVNEKLFSFDKAKYPPNVQVNDLRD